MSYEQELVEGMWAPELVPQDSNTDTSTLLEEKYIRYSEL